MPNKRIDREERHDVVRPRPADELLRRRRRAPGFGLARVGSRPAHVVPDVSPTERAPGPRHKLGTASPDGAGRKRARRRAIGAARRAGERSRSGGRRKRARRRADTFDTLAARFIEDYAKPHQAVVARRRPADSVHVPAEVEGAPPRPTSCAQRRPGPLGPRWRTTRGGVDRQPPAGARVEGVSVGDVTGLHPGQSGRRPAATREGNHHGRACCPDDELRVLWARLRDAEGDETLPVGVALWLRLRLLTAQRGGSRGADEVGRHRYGPRRVWQIPAADMKALRPSM